MQSKIALIGLALANLAVTSPCKAGHSISAAPALSLTSSVPSVAISETSSATIPQSSTTAQEEETIVTNALPGGGFSAPDPNNPPTFLQNFQGTGDVKFHQGGCFKEDGSKDDGCASLTASGNPAGKRDVGSIASLFQMLNSLNTGARSLYTVQFYYIVASSGSQACTVSASLGNTQFYSNSLSSAGGASVLWNHVLTTVVADSASATFSISMSCTGNGVSMILVDSIFISNQVTPQSIGEVKLDFGTPAVDPPVTTSKAPITTDGPYTASSPSPAVTDFPEATSEEPIRSTSDASSNVDQTTVSGVNLPTESASSTIPPILPRPSTAMTESENEGSTPTPGTPAASSTIPPIIPKPSTAMTQSQDEEVTPTPGTPAVTPVVPVTSVTPVPTIAPEETRSRSEEAQPTETRNIVCGYVGQYTGSGGPYEADHTAFPNQRSLKACRQACDGIRYCKAVAFVTWNKGQNPGYCLFADNRITWDTLVNYDEAAYKAVWADPECDFDLISVPELSFPTSTMAPVDSQPTTLATRTSQQPEITTSPADICVSNRGQSCVMAPSKLEPGTFCAYGAKFIGTQWKESRQDYPYQDTLEQCAAICQTMENCESAGYWQTENRCIFSAKKITASDFTINNDRSFEHAIWRHKSCWTCPSCQAAPAPIIRAITCSYEQGDVCQRTTSNKDGALCNYQGLWELQWMEYLERYPDQSSPAKCAAICRTRDDCLGSGYKDGRCMFSPILLETQKFRDWPDHSRDGVWDDISCFECPHCA
ncbi:hypothetical protein FLAG1_10108 [Fusarium langsethiae]|uniref:Apple domain-containing protein n=1 Tax=Fusarium langsethiae TaxID=179993 RepID=A0A0N0DBP8_FUSLA|nr:hypothetical protein FLAG1_10108 [Fusarium langsethiae]GKU06024.1 unnamed protein product [Fusarium langsethiae]GKU20986.1 unnamed protein product [Fusarium langsethiae]